MPTNEDIEQFIYANCPECGKKILLSHYCYIKRHKKDNGIICPGSGYRVPGYRYRMQQYLYGDED